MAKKKIHVSDFARNQLEKCGWTEGAGLGQTGQGITEAIKVNLKRDSHGVGHDSGKQFTHHWWNNVYDKAAASITVKHAEDGDVSVSKVEEAEAKSARAGKAVSTLYNNFVKSSTVMKDGVETRDVTQDSDSDSSSDEDKARKNGQLDDDELFRICGGRTAHKGARHGLKLSGKLARIAAQEAQHSSREGSPLPSKSEGSPLASKQEGSPLPSSSPPPPSELVELNITSKKSRKKLKKSKKSEKLGNRKLDASPKTDVIDDVIERESKKKKRSKSRTELIETCDVDYNSRTIDCQENDDSISETKTKKKKKKRKLDDSESHKAESTEITVNAADERTVPKKKKKKKQKV